MEIPTLDSTATLDTLTRLDTFNDFRQNFTSLAAEHGYQANSLGHGWRNQKGGSLDWVSYSPLKTETMVTANLIDWLDQEPEPLAIIDLWIKESLELGAQGLETAVNFLANLGYFSHASLYAQTEENSLKLPYDHEHRNMLIRVNDYALHQLTRLSHIL